ncbi:hypothetical protein STEG23_015044 [Scotinomys teguina]
MAAAAAVRRAQGPGQSVLGLSGEGGGLYLRRSAKASVALRCSFQHKGAEVAGVELFCWVSPGERRNPDSYCQLGVEQAYAVRKMIRSIDHSMKNKLKIDFSSDGRNAVVQVEDVSLSAKLVNLPCVVESLKTVDRKQFYKTADISQMLVCSVPSEPRPLPGEPVSSTDPFVTEKSERKAPKRKYNWKHGITPPLKSVRKKRFRKTAKKPPPVKQMDEISINEDIEYSEFSDVENEIKRLLCSDGEAISVRWEVIADEETKEIESQGYISGILRTPQTSGSPSSEMFGDSGSNSIDVEDDTDEIEVEDDDDDGEESDDDGDDDDDDDDEEEYKEDEKKTDSWEADLEKELQAQLIPSSSDEANKDYDYSSIISGIQKLIYYKERKLQQICEKAQRQKDLLRNVANLTLKRHFSYVLEQLNILEKQKYEEVQTLHMFLQTVDEMDVGVGYLVALFLGLDGSWVGQPASFPSSSPPRAMDPGTALGSSRGLDDTMALGGSTGYSDVHGPGRGSTIGH